MSAILGYDFLVSKFIVKMANIGQCLKRKLHILR